MTTQFDSVSDLEQMLRGSGATLTPVDENIETTDLVTEDGRFAVSKPQTARKEQLVTLYRTDTGEPVPTPLNEVSVRMSKRYPDIQYYRDHYPALIGQYVFTPGRQREKGGIFEPPTPLVQDHGQKLLCMLNPQSPDYPYIQGLGIRSRCGKANIPNVIELENHIKGHHGGVWDLIERDRDRRERAERDRRQDAMIELLMRERGIEPPPRETPEPPVETFTDSSNADLDIPAAPEPEQPEEAVSEEGSGEQGAFLPPEKGKDGLWRAVCGVCEHVEQGKSRLPVYQAMKKHRANH